MSFVAPNLKVPHCFFGAEGGVSGGKYASLNTNFNSQDDKDNIRRNFDRIAAHFSLSYGDMFTVKQGVSATAVFAEKPSQFEITADGMVTTSADVLLGIKTADCAPVLFADRKNGVIGAAHAGWRGAYKGIAENVLKLMLEHGAEKQYIAAAIGPCMQKESFEVMADMRDIFLQLDGENSVFFRSAEDGAHFYFDLSGYLENRLHRLGIDNVVNSHIDTYPPENGYFSYRRQTHLHTVSMPRDYPTQYSCICL